MIKSLTILFLMGFTFYTLAEQNFLSRCYNRFRSSSVRYNLPENPQWASPYAKELFSSVYEQLPILEGKVLSVKETQQFVSHFEKLINHMESSSNPNIEGRLNFMNSRWSDAVRAFPLIVSFVNSGKTAKYKSLDVNTIIKLILSTLGHHTMAYLTHSESESLDWPRIGLILKSISEFESEPSVFSLYKIKRAIVGKYSLNEYINCK